MPNNRPIAGSNPLGWKSFDKGDQLPADYRGALLHLMSFQADSEFAGSQRLGEAMRFVPRPVEATRLSQTITETVGHAASVWGLMSDLGVDADARLRALTSNPADPDPAKVNVIEGFRRERWDGLITDWTDLSLYLTVVIPAALTLLDQHRDGSYRPWARLNARIHKEKQGHLAFGIWSLRRILQEGGDQARDDAILRLPKFMRLGLGFFGRPDSDGGMFRYRDCGLRVRGAEVLQAEYLEMLDGRLKEIGLPVPTGVEPDYDNRIGFEATDRPVREVA